jgi:hypothetical protein
MVRFPRDEGNRVVDFKDMPKICEAVAIIGADRIYKVTEIIRKPCKGAEATIMVRR